MSWSTPDAGQSLELAVRLATVPLLLSSLESLAARADWAEGGLLNWRVARLARGSRKVHLNRATKALLDQLGELPFRLLLVVQLVATAALLCRPTLTPVLALALAIHILCMKRHYLSNDGSDDAAVAILLVVLVSRIGRGGDVQLAAALVIAAEACLAYFVSGLSKLQSDVWRSGDALERILRTRIFGAAWAAALLARLPRLARLNCRLIVLWEFAFVLVLFVPVPVALAIVGLGVLFHAGCAVIMGLNTFLWSFAATYPAVIFANVELHRAVGTGWCLVFALATGLALAVVDKGVRPAAALDEAVGQPVRT